MAANGRHEPVTMRALTFERASDRELMMSRTFNGPARIVFDAWTRPEHVRRWWAPTSLGVEMLRCEADVRVGGHYRYVLQPAKGEAFAFAGTYTEITPPARLVYTTFFEPGAVPRASDDDAAIVTVTFDERDGQTHVVARELYPSKEILDAAIATGMERGVHVTMDQLDELVASLS
jgi:uncharacterized protein YndB with AHSA1/START domain